MSKNGRETPPIRVDSGELRDFLHQSESQQPFNNANLQFALNLSKAEELSRKENEKRKIEEQNLELTQLISRYDELYYQQQKIKNLNERKKIHNKMTDIEILLKKKYPQFKLESRKGIFHRFFGRPLYNSFYSFFPQRKKTESTKNLNSKQKKIISQPQQEVPRNRSNLTKIKIIEMMNNFLDRPNEDFRDYNFNRLMEEINSRNIRIMVNDTKEFNNLQTFINLNENKHRLITDINNLIIQKRILNKIVENLSYFDAKSTNVLTNEERRRKKENYNKLYRILYNQVQSSIDTQLNLLLKRFIHIFIPSFRNNNNLDLLGNKFTNGELISFIHKLIIARKCGRQGINNISLTYNIIDPTSELFFTNGNLIDKFKRANYCDTNVRGEGFCSIWAFFFGYFINNPQNALSGTKIEAFLIEVLNSNRIREQIQSYLLQNGSNLASTYLFTNGGDNLDKLHVVYILVAIHIYCIALKTLRINFDGIYTPEDIIQIRSLCQNYNFSNINIENYNEGFECLINRLIFPQIKLTINGLNNLNGLGFTNEGGFTDRESIEDLKNRLSNLHNLFKGVLHGAEYYSDLIFYFLSYFVDSPFVQLSIQNIIYSYNGNITIRKPLLHIYNSGAHYHSLNPKTLYNYNKTTKEFTRNKLLTIWFRNSIIDLPDPIKINKENQLCS